MTFFSHWPGFSNFPSLLPDFPDLCSAKSRTWPFPQKKNTFFYSFHTFAHIRQHYFSKIWGTNAWPSPHLKLWGAVRPVPPRFPPLTLCLPMVNLPPLFADGESRYMLMHTMDRFQLHSIFFFFMTHAFIISVNSMNKNSTQYASMKQNTGVSYLWK